MKCTCGATVPLTSRSSICEGCLHPNRARSRSKVCECSAEKDAEDDEHADFCPVSPDFEEDEDYGDPHDGDREFADYGYDY